MAKYLLLLCALWLSYYGLTAQNQRIVDSLRCEIQDKSGRAKAELLLDIGAEYVDVDNDEAFAFIQCGLEEARASADTLTIVSAMRMKGQVLYRMQRVDEAIELFRSTLKISEAHGLTKNEMMTSVSLAVILTFRCEYDKALQKLFRAKEIALGLNDTAEYQLTLNNIGVVYYKLKNYNRALYYWEDALRLEKTTGNMSPTLEMNISLAYANLKDFDKAKKFLRESVSRCGGNCPDALMVHLKYTSGYIFLGLKEYSAAEKLFLTSYEYSKRRGDHRMQLDNIYLLAEVYEKQGKSEEALGYLILGEALINQGLPYNLEIVKLYHRLSEVYLLMKDFERASFYQSRYISLKDSLYAEEFTNSLMSTEAELLEKANHAQISAQKEIIGLKEDKIYRQTFLNIVIILLASTISTFCVFLYRSFRLKKRLNLLLEEKISKRTHELECSRDELLRSMGERDMLITRAATQISQTVRSIKGLCFTGREDTAGSAVEYFERIERTSFEINSQLDFLFQQAAKSSND